MLEKSLRKVEDFPRRFSFKREDRGAGLFETIVREAGGRQMILREEGG